MVVKVIIVNVDRPSEEDLEDVVIYYYECQPRNGHHNLPRMREYRWDRETRLQERLANYYGRHDTPILGETLYIE
ncbi:hypothetical protein J4416_05005 [Candidatus Pacearchaeota archaeon]|nr:hypothetical protein [Candidatus Pacearchaeota archaeon]